MAKPSKITPGARQNSTGLKHEAPQLSRGRATPERELRRKAGTSTPRKAGPRPHLQLGTVVTQFTFSVNSTRALACVPAGASAVYSLTVAANLTGVHPEMLRYYCRRGLLGKDRADSDCEPTFDEDAIHEVRRIEYYRRHLVLGRRAIPLICKLRREAERQCIEIHFLRCP